MENVELPKGWIEVKFTEILDIQGGTQPPKSQFIYEPRENYIRLLQIRDFGKSPVPNYIPSEDSLKRCKEEDILIARYGASIGRILTGMEGAYNVAMAKVIIPDLIDRQYVYHLLRSYIFQNPICSVVRTAQNGFNKDDLDGITIPLPPLAEQKRIVAEIETVLSWVSEAQEELDKIPALLRVFRQKVLAMAVSGELTRDFRGNTEGGNGKKLLEKLALERKNQYDVELKEALKNNLKKPKKPIIAVTYTDGWFEIPKNWAWTNFDSACEKIFDGTHFSPINLPEGEFKYITAKNIKTWGIDLKNISYVTKEIHKSIYERADVKRNDILYIKDGATAGIATLNTLDEEFSLLSSVGVFRTNSKFISPSFMNYYLNGCKNQMLAQISGVAITRLTLEKLKRSPFPVPPIAEQTEIVKRVEALFDWLDLVEAAYTEGVSQLKVLPQSLLHKAFSGQLVAQDPTDEPASVLLKRIQAEKKRQAEAAKAAKKK